MERSEINRSSAPILIIAAFLILGTLIIIITPFGEFGDEGTHLRFTLHIRDQHRLPSMSFDEREMPIQEAFQPPLYYLLGSVLVWHESQHTAVYILRFFSLLLAALSVWLICKSTRMIFPKFPYITTLAAAFAAFNTGFLYVHCGITNIAAMTAACSLTIFFALMLLSQNEPNLMKYSCLLGLSFGAAMLARTISVYVLPVCVGAIYYSARKVQQNWLKPLLIFCCLSFLIAGWWYIRNWITVGDPFAWKLYTATVGNDWVRREPFNLSYVGQILAFLHAYFWCYFGPQRYHAGIAEYAIYLFLEVLAVIGLFQIYRKQSNDRLFESTAQRVTLVATSAAAAFALAEVLSLQWRLNHPEGRWLYMSILPFSILLSAGITKLIPVKRRIIGANLVAVFLFVFSVYLLLHYWLPHYS